MDSEVRKLYRNELFHVRRSVKYHDHRKRFFENALNVALFLAMAAGPTFLVLGLSLSSAEIQDPSAKGVDWLKYVPALFTSIFTGAVLLSKAGSKANLYDRLRARYIELRQDMERTGDACTRQDVAEFTARRLEIEVDEPPINRVVDAISHNQVCQSMGIRRGNAYVKIKLRHRLLGSFTRAFDTSLATYKKGDGPGWLSHAAPD